tara:strand:- start:1045 stop:1794 length:750 start_codon:yes stop_codon:yes gene_type:complete
MVSTHFGHVWLHRRLLSLLVSLILFIVLYPFLADTTAGAAVLTLLLTLVLLAGIFAVSKHRIQLAFALILGVPWLFTSWANLFTYAPLLDVLTPIFGIIFYLYTITILFLHIIHTKRITSDILFGAVSIYLLLGLFWASIYVMINAVFPGAFLPVGLAWSDFLYYSFITLTSLGYGDIIPVLTFARSIAMLEVVVGVLYITILIARLVGLYTAQSAKEIAEANVELKIKQAKAKEVKALAKVIKKKKRK